MSVSAESKKEEFQKYLEKNGVIDQLTKVLVGLYEAPEKPSNAIDFIKEYLGAAGAADAETVSQLKETIEAQKKELAEKQAEIDALKAQVGDKPAADAPAEGGAAAAEAAE